jgi:hypothetical protein
VIEVRGLTKVHGEKVAVADLDVTVRPGILLILPLVVHFLPAQSADDIGTWLPSNAGRAVLTVGTSPLTSLGPWAGFGVLCGWVALTVIAAAVLLPRREV